jgi:hypothetical protein
MSYLDVDTDTVVTAGHHTAATSTNWQTWAHNTETTLREASTVVQDGTVSSAVQTFLGTINPTMQSMAQQVDALGGNTSTAANVVTNADGTAASALNNAGVTGASTGSHLSRGIYPI